MPYTGRTHTMRCQSSQHYHFEGIAGKVKYEKLHLNEYKTKLVLFVLLLHFYNEVLGIPL